MRALRFTLPLALALAACAGTRASSSPAPTATATSTATLSIPVSGMTCGGCARRVTSAIQGVSGVTSAQVLLAEKRAVVTYDPARVQPAAIAEAVRSAGYAPGEPVPVRN